MDLLIVPKDPEDWRQRDLLFERHAIVMEYTNAGNLGDYVNEFYKPEIVAREVEAAKKKKKGQVEAQEAEVQHVEEEEQDYAEPVLAQIPAAHMRVFAKQLLVGLRAIHEAGVVHCDVKMENVLVHDDALEERECFLREEEERGREGFRKSTNGGKRGTQDEEGFLQDLFGAENMSGKDEVDEGEEGASHAVNNVKLPPTNPLLKWADFGTAKEKTELDVDMKGSPLFFAPEINDYWQSFTGTSFSFQF